MTSIIRNAPTVTDDFNRADAPDAGANYTSHNGQRSPIESNKLASTTQGNWDNRVESFSADQYAEYECYGHTTAAEYNYRGFQLRQDDEALGQDRLMTWLDHYPADDQFYCYFGYKTEGSAKYPGPTVILQASDYAEGFLIRAEVVGDTVTFYLNGEKIFSTERGRFVTGDGIANEIGISMGGNSAGDSLAVDNFIAGEIQARALDHKKTVLRHNNPDTTLHHERLELRHQK